MLTTVKLIDHDQNVIATARVTREGNLFGGQIDLSVMPTPLLRTFEEYEEIVNGQMFSLLDEIEAKIDALALAVVFEDGQRASVADVQIYPGEKRVSFKAPGTAAHDGENGRSLQIPTDPEETRLK